MSDPIGGGMQDSIRGAAQGAAEGAQDAADHVQRAVCGAACGVREVRAAIRAQPITAAFVLFGAGYLFRSLH
jgi:hypothetical protein